MKLRNKRLFSLFTFTDTDYFLASSGYELSFRQRKKFRLKRTTFSIICGLIINMMRSFLRPLFVLGVFFNNYSHSIENGSSSLRGQEMSTLALSRAPPSRRSLEPRIIGGAEATPGRYNYFVSLIHPSYGHFCGGTLIGPSVVLSAAHCSGGTYHVVINSYNLTSSFEERKIEVREEVLHPRYGESVSDEAPAYDYMIIFLAESVVSRNQTIEYMKLNPDPEVPQSGDPVVTIGHGLTEESGVELSSILMEVEVFVVSNQECKDSNSEVGGQGNSYGNLIIDEAMLCAADTNEDSCSGDSGGPLLIKGNDPSGAEDVQIGIVSWGFGCADPMFPGVYSRVSGAYEWITRVVCSRSDDIQDGFDCDNLPPTTSPTASPTIVCPSAYDPSKTDYGAGDQVVFNSNIYQCLADCFTQYCSIESSDSEWDMTTYTLWKHAWVLIGECDSKQDGIISPNSSKMPTIAPSRFSSPPTIGSDSATSSYPSETPAPTIGSDSATSSYPSETPAIAPSSPPSISTSP